MSFYVLNPPPIDAPGSSTRIEHLRTYYPPYYAVTEPLMLALRATTLSGLSISPTPFTHPKAKPYYWLTVHGTPGEDDFGVNEGSLVVSREVTEVLDQTWQPRERTSPLEEMMDVFKLPQYGIDLRWVALVLCGILILFFGAVSFAATPTAELGDVNAALRWSSACFLILALCGFTYWIYVTVSNIEKLLFSALLPVPLPFESYQRVKNIVEGISLASGAPIPKAFSINNSCTNAFTITDGKQVWLFMTTGLLSLLNRAELEAAVAHEFSHIVEGDLWRFRISYLQLWRTVIARFKHDLRPSLTKLLLSVVVLTGAVTFTVLVYLRSQPAGEMLMGLYLMAGLFLAVLPQAFLPRPRHTKVIPLQKGTVAQQVEQEFKADRNAAMWTYNPEAAAGAIRKASKNGLCKELDYLAKISFVPVTRHWRKSIYQPGAEERLRRIAEMGHFDPKQSINKR